MGRVHVTSNGSQIHVGGRRRPPKKFGLALDDKKYGLDLSQWPTTPASTSYGDLPTVQDLLKDILGNGDHGDCTIADRFKRQGLRQAVGGRPVFHPTLDQVLAVYSRCGGYVPDDPSTDNGCVESVVLTDERDVGNISDGSGCLDKTTAYMTLDPANTALVRACATLFPGLPVCAELPEPWIDSVDSSDTWAVPDGGYVAVPADGHCFTLVDQTEAGAVISTWGRRKLLPWDALATCASDRNGGSIFVVVDDEMLSLAANKAPDGLDWDQAIADFQSLPGSVMIPPGP